MLFIETIREGRYEQALSAIGYQVFGAQCVDVAGKKICFPGATVGHLITGDGKTITYQEASADDNFAGGTAGGNFCNWHIDGEYRDTAGKVYFTDPGPMHNTCEGAFYPIGRKDNKRRVLEKYGAPCAVLWANGVRLAAQCHSITAWLESPTLTVVRDRTRGAAGMQLGRQLRTRDVALGLVRLVVFLWVGYIAAMVLSAILGLVWARVPGEFAAYAALPLGLGMFTWTERRFRGRRHAETAQ